MESVTLAGGAVYRHVPRPEPAGPLACPACGERQRLAFHSWRRRVVEHVDAERPTYLVLPVGKWACRRPDCPRKYFTPPLAAAAPHARTSRRLQQTAARLYRRGQASLQGVAAQLRQDWHTGTGKTSVLRWHRATLAQDCPRPERLAFSGVLCIDEVYDSVAGRRVPTWTCVDPLAGITVRLPIERADAAGLAAAMRQVKALGAEPRVIVSDLWAAYPEALAQVWPGAERQLCWFHVMQWTTRQLAALLKAYGRTLPEGDRKALQRLRFRLLACPETLERQARRGRLSARTRQALARAWERLRGTVVEDAVRLRDDLRAVLNGSRTRRQARERFAARRQTWPAPFRPRPGRLASWRPGQPLPPASDEPPDLHGYLDQLRAFFVRHFEALITYLDYPGVPRTNNHAERANRRYRAAARVRYGWATQDGQRAMLVALQGFDSS